MQKVLKVFSVFIMLVTSLIGLSQVTFAETSEAETLTPKEQQTAEVVLGGISRYVDKNGDFQLRINDIENLQVELESINASVSAIELKEAIDRFNYLIVAEDGEGAISNLVEDVSEVLPDPNSRLRGKLVTCSNVMGAIGLIHAGSYSAAAYLLGITGPASLLIPLIVSTAYYLGGLLC
ncbi:hypothetical protein LI951_01940 [Enterococcus sp. BWT-B8]|uniref:hypothetical protein n=1 Tax=unclassified Enterococcus TaxID=2608891 RepID=UPI001E63EA07|nr:MULTISPECIES: hypothetical protein [unclassified Enterococcus]MCB5950824.1 hypothetical protein [Enterococcus sp. BWT-B8]MCB5955264.1 hypothetical protein [Enterococcus sp. CWB-B31]